MAGSESSNAWATATAISLEKDLEDTEDATVTTTWAAEDDGAKEDIVENKPADKLLKVEFSCDILREKARAKLMYVLLPDNLNANTHQNCRK